MTLIIFIVILGVLVLVHELGHFIFAKKAGVRVEEFGFGYPPRAVTLGEKWGTKFSLNWIPFGGFVKIFGENYDAEIQSEKGPAPKVLGSPASRLNQTFVTELSPTGRSFTQVSKIWQAVILFAGVLFNFLFAWLLFSIGFVSGLPTPVQNDYGYEVKDPALTIVAVLPNSPASNAGLKSGDKILSVESGGAVLRDLEPEAVSDFISGSSQQINMQVNRGGKEHDFSLLPDAALMEGRKIVGINMDMVGTLSLPVHQAFVEGGRVTLKLTYLTVTGILGLIGGAFTGSADLSQVTGPIGIVGLVGDASRLGLAYLLTFTALISINLAVVNLLPFPALDGGRLVFVAIEAITRKKIPAKFGSYANGIGFAVLVGLMIIITFKDIKNLF